jgi:heme ABC exporter ATP-binding subunit CcmA
MPLRTTDSQSEFAIDAHGIARRFGARWVLRGVSLQVRPGEIVGLLGANGSGKSTLLRIFATLLKPSAGTALVYGHDLSGGADQVRAQVGFLAHSPGLYDDLSARENLVFAAAMLGLDASGVDAVLARVGLGAVASHRVRGFSAGMQRRLSLARLLLTRKRVLLLDEPYANLDIDGIVLMNAVMRDSVEAGGAALVVLHELAPAAGVLDRTVTIVDGRIAGAGEAVARKVPLVAVGAQ